MKKLIITIILYLLSLFLFLSQSYYFQSLDWFSNPTDLQSEIYGAGISSAIVLFILFFSTKNLVLLLPWPQIRQKLFKRKAPPPADPE